MRALLIKWFCGAMALESHRRWGEYNNGSSVLEVA